MDLPLFQHHIKGNSKSLNRKWAVLVRHELWIGNLLHEHSTFDTDFVQFDITNGMRFNQEFRLDKIQYCDLARETCISFTVFLCKLKGGGNKDESSEFEQMISIAFV